MSPQSQSGTGMPYRCKQYSPISVYDKHCEFYRDSKCSRTGQRCIEWLRRNPSHSPNPVDVDLFGNPILESKPRPKQPLSTPRKIASQPRRPLKPLSGFTPELIDSFKRLQTEIHFTSDTGRFWLVPEYRDPSRGEITPEHLAFICNVLTAFPDATVVAFENISSPKTKENSHE